MATCGWVLGPPSDRTLFDRVLPKETAVSCINREVGKAPVDPMFARIDGRSKWAIPWLEDDPALTSPQLWAGRMRKDAVDALAYGDDPWTRDCEARFRELFGPTTETFLVWGGTGANVMALATMLGPAEAVVCSAGAHSNVDETGAPERVLGAQLIDLPGLQDTL